MKFWWKSYWRDSIAWACGQTLASAGILFIEHDARIWLWSSLVALLVAIGGFFLNTALE